MPTLGGEGGGEEQLSWPREGHQNVWGDILPHIRFAWAIKAWAAFDACTQENLWKAQLAKGGASECGGRQAAPTL